MQVVNWDDLRIFLSVAQTGQLARAAHLLGLDATTAGRRLRRLEKTLGQTLFEQRRDGQKLTEAGARLLVRAEAVAATMRAVDSEAHAAYEPEGVVRVSITEGFGASFVAEQLPAFAALYPRIGIDLVATSGFLSPSRRETDVAILLARPSKGPLVTRKLTDYGLGLYAAADYLRAAPPIAAPSDLRDHALIGYIPDLLPAPELDYLDEIAPGLAPRLRSSSITAQHRMVAAGAGIAVLHCFAADRDPALVRVLPEVRLQRSFWLVTHEDSRAIPRVRLFLDWLVALAEAERARLVGT